MTCVLALRYQDFKPHIHLAESDFAAITADGSLCGNDGSLGPKEFEEAMRRQVMFASS